MMHHITWIDLYNRTFHDELVGELTKATIEHYERMGFAQILNVREVVK